TGGPLRPACALAIAPQPARAARTAAIQVRRSIRVSSCQRAPTPGQMRSKPFREPAHSRAAAVGEDQFLTTGVVVGVWDGLAIRPTSRTTQLTPSGSSAAATASVW